MATRTDSAAYLDHKPTYHTIKDAAYVLPNGATEHVRLEAQARCLSNIMNSQIIHAPIPTEISKALMLDVGCGTGIVTDHLGTRFPNAQIFGLDLSPTPNIRDHPPNVHFLQGNVTHDRPTQWLSQTPGIMRSAFENDPVRFDLIFSRLLVCGLSDWPGYIRKAYTLLTPGGYMECHDITWRWYDQTQNSISDAWKWLAACHAAGKEKDMDFLCGERIRGWMEDAGFEDVNVVEYRWPMGGEWETDPEWREWGDYNAAYIPPLVWHMIPKLLEGRGYSDGEMREMQEEVVRNLSAEEGKHWIMQVTVGRKPVE